MSGKPALAFGNKVEPTQARSKNSDERLAWEQGSNANPYWQQGSDAFDSQDMVALRASLKKDGRVKAEIAKFWSVYKKGADGKISKAEYLNVHVKYTLVLIPDITPEEARSAGEEDWASDSGGADSMTKVQLFHCLFELADMWVNSVDGAE